jgi:hypothetical protein
LNRFFESLVHPTPDTDRPPVVVHSSPATTGGPWVITMDDFVTAEECERLIAWGSQLGYERSEDVGELLFDGTYTSVVSADRTSANTWCSDECLKDPLIDQLEERIFRLTGIPRNNSEYLQLLHYKVSTTVEYCAFWLLCMCVSYHWMTHLLTV